ncbi:hypothetical protein [Sphingopyxis sp. GW247-27LB]|uniref:hypothetical protein n=1 Tax=Sphingopyxis sp. GW247-27LB TaxID=2012632 RepID=UPI000BA5B1FE|nr:hypothetical protein [Sphingopyxis sp. GW247-27LB]PAL23575.1 hypothetical protein CD928_05775 [Sphingopyxis sp. GW247-27LB]
MERVEVKTKTAAEKAIKAGKPVRIVGGSFALALVSLTGVDIQVAADVEISTTDVQGCIVTRGTSAPRIVTRGTSAPCIETWETSAPCIETWETSAPRIVTRGTSAPCLDANGFSYVFTRGDRLTGKAAANVIIRVQGNAKIEGGLQFQIKLETPQDWCDFYGVRVEDGCAIVYKAVGEGYRSKWGTTYEPGSTPIDHQWNGRKEECSVGGGLNFSPTPRHTHQFVSNPRHYLECRVRLDENFAVHFGGQYPEKICHKEVAVPLVEVDIDGERI